MDFLREKPLRTWLQERKTVVPRPKLVTSLTKRSVPPVSLPAGITREEAVDTIAGTNWARGIAQGIADKGGLAGRARTDFISEFSRAVAEGIVTSSYLPLARRGRPPGTGKKKKKGVIMGKDITPEKLTELGAKP